jgi:cyanamide hydratase
MTLVDEVARNGWTAVPLDAGVILRDNPQIYTPERLLLDNIEFPSDDPVVQQVQRYAKQHLPIPTYNHSMRAYYFGKTMFSIPVSTWNIWIMSYSKPGMVILKQQFPKHAASLLPATMALTCLLHDIGTTKTNMNSTRMSFEFSGGIQSLKLLVDSDATSDQAEAVCEAIIRHQDLGTNGSITLLGQILQMATIYDNVSKHPTIDSYFSIIHEKTREDIIAAFPRENWLACFAKSVREELRLKPWCHSTHIPNMEQHIRGNELMKPYERI